MTLTTLRSVENALQLLMRGGIASITCYPGHEEGEKEEMALLSWLKTLNFTLFAVVIIVFLVQ